MISCGKYSGSIKLVASSLSYFFLPATRLQIMWNTFNHKYVIGMCCDNQLPISVRWFLLCKLYSDRARVYVWEIVQP